MTYVDDFWRDGFVVIKGALDREGVLRWRRRALEPGANLKDPLSDPVLKEIVLCPAIIRLAEEILGAKPRYMGDATAVVGTGGGSGFHKDSCDRHDPNGPDWMAEKHPVLQFGIYTQPHGPLTGGLSLRRGSHMHADEESGEPVTPKVRPGDLIIWTSRTTHSGNTPNLRILGTRIVPNSRAWKLLRPVSPDKKFARTRTLLAKFGTRYLLKKHPQERVVFILAYGSDHPIADRHLRYLGSRGYIVRAWQSAEWGPELYEEAAARGLKLHTKEELLALASDHPNEQHVPLPY